MRILAGTLTRPCLYTGMKGTVGCDVKVWKHDTSFDRLSVIQTCWKWYIFFRWPCQLINLRKSPPVGLSQYYFVSTYTYIQFNWFRFRFVSEFQTLLVACLVKRKETHNHSHENVIRRYPDRLCAMKIEKVAFQRLSAPKGCSASGWPR
jgi:hypothetical protein